ncbi:MAG: ABC transporter substrate-binding protein [Gammaproteobacteria bacterium]|nr:ABC transporter substrate-binding protein [Gammaproteobacteria bacterium]NIR84323.1 ABC transporter substrate-binding protein [Gammaproteobacteria bacterium]NIR89839.1 ABC transporter substrate-binding protein [Gammaproteobacteria bacterium]NIU05706.1 ABC transporter substrate-binding protein [Gammaproteobacteria bacterium]NIV52466.1 ABC transporter substrate-binding protein [Gammaproteobacteria bacterium]
MMDSTAVPRRGRRDFIKMGGVALAAGAFAPLVRGAGKDTVKVGASLPLTGRSFFVEDGLRQLLGYRLWQEHVNRRDGLLGRPVQVVVHDDAAEAQQAAEVYRRLLEEGVQLLLGNYSSGVAGDTIPVVEAAGVPCVFPMAWQPGLWLREHQWAVPTLPLATEVTRTLLEYLERQGVRRVAVVNADNAYAQDLAKGLVQRVRELGLTLTAHQTYSFGDRVGLEAALTKALGTGPDALAGGNVGDQVPELAKAARAAGPEAGHYAWFELDEPVILEARDAVEGMIGFGLWIPGMPYPGNREFVRRFTNRWEREYPEEPIGLLLDHHAAAGYGAAQVLEAAVTEASTLEPAAVRDALFSFETTTVFGRYRLDARGVQVGKTVPVVGYRHGLREVLWPQPLATV